MSNRWNMPLTGELELVARALVEFRYACRYKWRQSHGWGPSVDLSRARYDVTRV